MKLFVENVLHPSLRTKKIKGQKDLYESSINMDIRIIWYFENEELIILVDIGHHDILKKFLKRLIVPYTFLKKRYRSSQALECVYQYVLVKVIKDAVIEVVHRSKLIGFSNQEIEKLKI